MVCVASLENTSTSGVISTDSTIMPSPNVTPEKNGAWLDVPDVARSGVDMRDCLAFDRLSIPSIVPDGT
ncbi:hypothetical protein ACQY1H_09985 [Agrobacterium vitis]|uniref:hypothetical protein n=1 Tax=Agrobacterium vitis TaxID=373 RepID=UPI003D2BF1F0